MLTSTVTSLDLLTTLEQGFLNDATAEPAMPDCPTGNCTWPIFPTLALCGSCTDLSKSLRKVCNNTANLDSTGPALPPGSPQSLTPVPFGGSTFGDGSFSGSPSSFGSTRSRSTKSRRWTRGLSPRQSSSAPSYCTYRMDPLAGFGYLDEDRWALPDFASYLQFKEEIPKAFYTSTVKSRTPVFRAYRPDPENVSRDGKKNESDFWRMSLRHNFDPITSKPSVHECRLNWCIQAWNLSVVDGRRRSEMVKQWSDFVYDWEQVVGVDDFATPSFKENFTASTKSLDPAFRAAGDAKSWTIQSINGIGDHPILEVFSAAARPPFSASQLNFTSAQARRMYSTHDVDKWIKNLAVSLTNIIRREGTSADHGTFYDGMAFSADQRFKVRFLWLP